MKLIINSIDDEDRREGEIESEDLGLDTAFDFQMSILNNKESFMKILRTDMPYEFCHKAVMSFFHSVCSLTSPDEEIDLARCLNLYGGKAQLNKNHTGRCWTSIEHKYDFAKRHLDRNELYCLYGKTRADNVDWLTSAYLLIHYNFVEWEIRMIDDTKVTDLDIEEVHL